MTKPWLFGGLLYEHHRRQIIDVPVGADLNEIDRLAMLHRPHPLRRLFRVVDLGPIEKLSGKKPRGYVAPWWEMSASTAELLLQNGFRYDHSQGYNDFVPFYARVGDENSIDFLRTSSCWRVIATGFSCE